MANTILDMRSITKEFPGVKALDNVNLKVEQGEIHALIGENGAGKSTLMNVLSGIYMPEQGHILKNGVEIQIRSPKDAFANGIGMIHQHFKLVDVLTVTENIILGLNEKGKLNIRAAAQKIDDICKKYGFDLDPMAKIYDLSVSQKQTVEIVKVLFRGAEILILDEPTSGLDPVSRDELLKILSEYIEDGEHSVLFSTHITGDLERAADYITYISYGELYFTGSKDDFVDMFRIVKGGIEELSDDLKNKAAGIRTFPTGFEALMKTEDINGFSNLTIEPATIDEIVVFTSKKGDDYE